MPSAYAATHLPIKSGTYSAHKMMIPQPSQDRLRRIESLFKTVRQFPIPDFTFPDINPLLNDPQVFADVIESFVRWHSTNPPDQIVCVESFGYLFGAPLAYRLHTGMALARRQGKLPREILSQEYEMIYSPKKTMEIQTDSCRPNQRVAVVDDFLATGGTAEAALKLLRKLGVKVSGLNFVVEVLDVGGRERISEYCPNIQSLIKLRYDKQRDYWRVEDLDASFLIAAEAGITDADRR